MSKSKSKQEEALQFLDDLDSIAPPPAQQQQQQQPAEGEAEVLAFLDEITQKSNEPPRMSTSHIDRPLSRAGTPNLRRSTERVKLGASSSTTSLHKSITPEGTLKPVTAAPAVEPQSTSTGGWGWGSVWSSASAAIQQAKTVVDEQVKHLPKNEQARKWGEGVIEYAKAAQLDKLGQDFKRVGLSTLTDLLNVVAPPISEHEVIQVWLSHDMRGYEGVESLVYRALARIMEQVEGGDLIVNRGDESRPKDTDTARDLNTVDGYEAALKLSQANLDALIKAKSGSIEQSTAAPGTSPTTYSHVFLRIQPYITTYPALMPTPSSPSTPLPPTAPEAPQQLHFLLHLTTATHANSLTHTCVTQAVPAAWLRVWERYDWVEDTVAEVLRVGVEVLGQEYVVRRMGWIAEDVAAPVDTEQEKE